MKIRLLAIAAATVIAASPVAFGQNQSSNPPGQQMLQKGQAPGSPGASGYAPGHLKKKHVAKRSKHRHMAHKKTHARRVGQTAKSETTGMATSKTKSKRNNSQKQY